MSDTVGYATLQVIPSMKGVSSAIENELAGAPKLGETAGQKTGSRFSKAAKIGLTAAAGLGVGLAAIFKTGFDEAKDASAGTAQLAAGIKSTGNAANVTVDGLNDLAGQIQNYSGQTDDSIVASEQLLLTFTSIKNAAGKNNDIFSQATKLTADMAAKMGTDASSSAVLLGKALNDPAKGLTALTRVGVSFTDGQQKQIKALQASGNTMGAQKLIIAELNKEFGGAAEAAGKSLPGQLARAKRSFEDLAQGVVEQLLPVIQALLNIFITKVMPVFQRVADFITEHKTVFTILAAVIGTVVVAVKTWTIAQGIFNAVMAANPVMVVVVAIAALVAGVVVAYQKCETFRDIVQGAFAVIKTAVLAVVDVFTVDIPQAFSDAVTFVTGLPARLATAGAKLWTWVLDLYKAEWLLVKTAVVDAVTFVTGIPARFAKAAAALWDWLLDLYKIEWRLVKTAVTDAVTFVTGIPNRFATAGASVWHWLTSKLRDAYQWVTGKFGDLVGFVTGLPARITKAAAGMWDGITDAFKGAINAIIGLWNGLHFSLGGWTIPVPLAPDIHVPKISFGVPQIPYLASGGMTTGPMAAVIGDNRSGREVALPLDAPQTRRALAGALAEAGGGGRPVTVVVELDGRQLARAVGPALADEIRVRTGWRR